MIKLYKEVVYTILATLLVICFTTLVLVGSLLLWKNPIKGLNRLADKLDGLL